MANIPFPQNPPDPHKVAGFLIWKNSLAWEKFLNEKLKPFGLSQSECFHLMCLWGLEQTNREVTQTQLAYDMGGSTMNTSKIMKSLEKKMLLTRVTASDSRAKSIKITENGKEILRKTAEIIAHANQDFFESKNNEFLTKLKKLLH
jgi:DNA-binding MarR family transcriptional regulator